MSDTTQPSPTIEDYLGVIYTLTRDGERVIGARLAETLDVSASTVTATVKRMCRDGWVRITSEKELELTEEGLKAGMSVIRRHMLTEWMLSRVLKLPLSELHREAHQIEHAISAEVAERLQSVMKDPMFCPHGNPLPGYEGETRRWVPISHLDPGDDFILQRIHESLEDDYKTLSFLEQQGLMPGVQGRVCDKLPFNETLHLEIGGCEVVLGLKLAHYLFVSKPSEG